MPLCLTAVCHDDGPVLPRVGEGQAVQDGVGAARADQETQRQGEETTHRGATLCPSPRLTRPPPTLLIGPHVMGIVVCVQEESLKRRAQHLLGLEPSSSAALSPVQRSELEAIASHVSSLGLTTTLHPSATTDTEDQEQGEGLTDAKTQAQAGGRVIGA